MGATSITGRGSSECNPCGEIVPIIVDPQTHQLLKHLSDIRKVSYSQIINELLEGNREKFEEEIKAHIELPEGSMGHLMGEFFKEIKDERQTKESKEADWGAGQ